MLDYVVVSVADLKEQFEDLEVLKQAFSEFKCARENDLEVFLRTKCLDYEQAGNCRTFLILDEKQLNEHSKLSIVAFFSTAIAPLDISALGKKVRKRLHGPVPLSKQLMSVFLIGQLGRNDSYSKEQMPGEVIINECFAAIERAKKIIGGRILLVECRGHLLSFYEKYGFIRVSKDESELYQLYKKIS
ncbi:hypothetical protein [Turicibacter sanguinis]|uniref:hypothetical protein n=1 Tax=Turicibacter sanguinis TaxID=154288 RepID=UPI0012BBC61F|nr:hypothetical protein [Turicibacter sanguinis]MDB8437707.1 hypothetical protein [Turicibacter sanguinis]MTP74144.1 hypothetical protein [Turicibacter sanguinis]